jgi:uncharacterized protein DUF6345
MSRRGRVVAVVAVLAALGASAATAMPAFAAPARLPVYQIASRGVTGTQAQRLARALGLPRTIRRADGTVRFVDGTRFQRFPSRSLGAGRPDEDGNPTFVEAFDFEALRTMTPFSDARARTAATAALRAAGIPAPGRGNIEHTTLQTFDRNGRQQTSTRLDTEVEFTTRLNGVPLMGPGAKTTVTFDPSGKVTRLDLAPVALRAGPSTPILSSTDADRAARQALDRTCTGATPFTALRLTRQLVYWVPAGPIRRVYPRYLYEPRTVIDGEPVTLNSFDLPAVRSGTPRPRLALSSNGSLISARTTVTGGRGPYRFTYSSCSGSLDSGRPSARRSRIAYRLRSERGERRETVYVTVTDADGLTATARAALTAQAVDPPVRSSAFASVGGSRDYGVWAVPGQFPNAGDEDPADFMDEMDDEVYRRFRFYDGHFDHTDLIDPALGGQDNKWGDNVDLAFVNTHGSPTKFNTGDIADISNFPKIKYETVTFNEALWGNGDLEWMALLTCEVLREFDSKNRGLDQRWYKALQGVHMILGFHTKALIGVGNGNEFGDNLADDGMRVIDAWWDAAESEQPDGRKYAAMGPIGPQGQHNRSDHAFGLGGGKTEDIQPNNGYWYLRGTV